MTFQFLMLVLKLDAGGGTTLSFGVALCMPSIGFRYITAMRQVLNYFGFGSL